MVPICRQPKLMPILRDYHGVGIGSQSSIIEIVHILVLYFSNYRCIRKGKFETFCELIYDSVSYCCFANLLISRQLHLALHHRWHGKRYSSFAPLCVYSNFEMHFRCCSPASVSSVCHIRQRVRKDCIGFTQGCLPCIMTTELSW